MALGRRDFLKLLGLTTGAILTAPVLELVAEPVVPALEPLIERVSSLFFRINGRDIAPVVERLDVVSNAPMLDVTCAHDTEERFVVGLRRYVEIEADLRGHVLGLERELGVVKLEFGDTERGVKFTCDAYLERYETGFEDGEVVGRVRVRPTGPMTLTEGGVTHG